MNSKSWWKSSFNLSSNFACFSQHSKSSEHGRRELSRHRFFITSHHRYRFYLCSYIIVMYRRHEKRKKFLVYPIPSGSGNENWPRDFLYSQTWPSGEGRRLKNNLRLLSKLISASPTDYMWLIIIFFRDSRKSFIGGHRKNWTRRGGNW